MNLNGHRADEPEDSQSHPTSIRGDDTVATRVSEREQHLDCYVYVNTDGFAVREWQPEDTPAVWRLVKETLPEYGFEADPETSEEDLDDINSSYLLKGGAFLILDHQGTLVGTVGFFRIDNVTCKLRKMYLRKEYRGRGLGKLLLHAAIAEAWRRGYEHVLLETSDRMREAVGLYLAAGFREVPLRPVSPRCDTTYRLSRPHRCIGAL
jgi:putative acetyltransferase